MTERRRKLTDEVTIITYDELLQLDDIAKSFMDGYSYLDYLKQTESQ